MSNQKSSPKKSSKASNSAAVEMPLTDTPVENTNAKEAQTETTVVEPQVAEASAPISYAQRLLSLEAAADKYCTEKELLEYGIEGKLTFCVRIPANVSLWVICQPVLVINGAEDGATQQVRASLTTESKSSYFETRDESATEWLNISPTDCRRILLTGTHAASIFDSGWKINEDDELERTNPAIASKGAIEISARRRITNAFLKPGPARLTNEWKFITHKANYKNSYTPQYSEPIEHRPFEFSSSDLFIADTELQQLLKEINPEKSLIKSDSPEGSLPLEFVSTNQPNTGSTNKSILHISTDKPNRSLWDRPYDSFYAKHSREPNATELLGWVEDMAKNGDHVFKFREIEGKPVVCYPYANGETYKPLKLKNLQNALDSRRKKAKRST